MPFDSNLPVAFVNDKGLMGADAIKEELCQGKDETCKGLTSVEMYQKQNQNVEQSMTKILLIITTV